MLIDEQMSQFYYGFALIANRILFVLGLFFAAFLFYLSTPLALLLLILAIGYYAYTEWQEETRRDAYAAQGRAAYAARE